jgi:hypothetical protein
MTPYGKFVLLLMLGASAVVRAKVSLKRRMPLRLAILKFPHSGPHKTLRA